MSRFKPLRSPSSIRRFGRLSLLTAVGLSLLGVSISASAASAASAHAPVVQVAGINEVATVRLPDRPITQGSFFRLNSFSSPSGNIRCSIYTTVAGRGAAVCDVEVRIYLPPGKPASCATENWGHRATVEGDTPRAVCRAKPQPAGVVLPYGVSNRVGEIWCTSDAYFGIRCVNTRSGVGFEINSRHLDLITAGGNLPITAPATAVHRYQPFVNSKPAPSLVVTSSLPGFCFGESDSTNNPNARRCASGHEIYDPCFVDPQHKSTSVLCPGDPRSNKVRELRNAANVEPADAVGEPFFVQLAGGQTCFAVGGSHSISHGLPDVYLCASASAKNPLSGPYTGTLLGGLNTDFAGWTAIFAGSDPATRQIVAITDAWK